MYKVNWHTTEWEKIFAKQSYDWKLLPKICKEFKQFNNNNNKLLNLKWMIATDILKYELYKWSEGM